MNKIVYVGIYDILHNGKRVRVYSLAAARKMDYICSVLNELGCDVEIWSPAYISADGIGYVESQTIRLNDKKTLMLPPSWSAKNKISRIIRYLAAQWWLFAKLVRECNKNSDVVVYHSYHLTWPVLIAKKLKGFRLLLEIEEKYSMVWKLNPYQKLKENLLLSHSTNSCLIVSELLAQKLGIKHPIVSYGNYCIYHGDVKSQKPKDRIRLVYSGAIDSVRNGAYMALSIMKYLPEQYELHISGAIDKGEEEKFYQAVKACNEECGREACSYRGILNDEDFSALLCSSHIALNLQQDGSYGEFLFPSKILTYLSYGLPVVSTCAESIKASALRDVICFTDDYSHSSIVKAILETAGQDNTDHRDKLVDLGNEFACKLRKYLLQKD